MSINITIPDSEIDNLINKTLPNTTTDNVIPKQENNQKTCKSCFLFEAAKSTVVENKPKIGRNRRLITLLFLILIPFAIALIFLLKFHLRSNNYLENKIVLDEDTDNDIETFEPDFMKQISTKFVAPTAVRLPLRSKRNNILYNHFNKLLLGNYSDIVLWETLNLDHEFTESEEEEAELMDSDEIIWENVSTDTDSLTTQITTTMISDQNKPELEWPGDFDDYDTVRKVQAGRMKEYMDLSANPCDDFYQYACGKWVHNHPIPRDKAGFDTFELLRERLDRQLRNLLEQEEKTNESLIYIKKAKDLYHSCMDHDTITKRGTMPLIRLLRNLGGWPAIEPNWDSESFDWIRLMADLRRMNNDILIAQWIAPDIKQSDEYVIQLDQTTLGLPSKNYFLENSNSVYLQAYRKFIINVLTLMGVKEENATITADEILQFEIKLAQITGNADERRDVSAIYKRWTLGYLVKEIPTINWKRFLSLVLGYSIHDLQPIVVYADSYFHRLADLIKRTQPRALANYLFWRFVRHRVGNLDDRFQEARQKFYYTLSGREQSPPRWKECVSQVNANMDMAVGSLFVKKHFDENSKLDTVNMTEELQNAFRHILKNSDWLDEFTKTLAKEKVDEMTLRIGYPDFILSDEELNKSYENINISKNNYFENIISLLKHASREERAILGSTVNKTVWNTPPAVVNAYYSRNKNQIMFPAGILQPPFYHKYFPKSLNFGGIGVVIGHEITHGFDDKGRLFDKSGNMQRWWPDAAIKNFQQRAKCLVDQYSQYTVKEVNMQVDGLNTRGENIADNGGIKQAFLAYENWLEENSNLNETLPGINATNKQLFFINYAQSWCGANRPETTRNKLKTAVHSPGKFRVIGALSNSEQFNKVFNCPIGSPMNPMIKCSVW